MGEHTFHAHSRWPEIDQCRVCGMHRSHPNHIGFPRDLSAFDLSEENVEAPPDAGRGRPIGKLHPLAFIALAKVIWRQKEWSFATFGPGPRTKGVTEHIRRELLEIEANPTDVREWVDVIILAFDGAWRAGHKPETIIRAWMAKLNKNQARKWPDWRTLSDDVPIEHVRGEE